LHDISISKQVESKEAEAENIVGTEIIDEEFVVEVIREDKKHEHVPKKEHDTTQAPSGAKLKKDTPSTYHHLHHPSRQQPTRGKRISNKDKNPGMTHRELQ